VASRADESERLRVVIAALALAASLHVSPRVMQETTRVAICEEGGWGPAHDAHGPKYFGHLGWLDSTWLEFRVPGSPRYMSQATREQEAAAMQRFSQRYGWPDQHGCSGSY
jgi:hypothetical protein